MAAYVIFIRERVRNQAAIESYKKMAPAGMAGFPVKVHAAYGRKEVLEGPEVEGVVILEFPTFEEAQNWYHSPQYQAAAEHRFLGADYRAIIVQGL